MDYRKHSSSHHSLLDHSKVNRGTEQQYKQARKRHESLFSPERFFFRKLRVLEITSGSSAGVFPILLMLSVLCLLLQK